MNLKKILKFVQLLNDFQKVERVIYVTGLDRQENDAEHSFQLAMLAWYMAESQKLSLDKNLLIKYALVHDLAEVFAGDVYLYTTDQESKDKKQEREREAAERLLQEYPEFQDLHELIQEYWERKNPESKFIYALDKLLPMLNIHNDNGRTWKKQKISLEMILEAKTKKVALSPEVKTYFDELVAILENSRDKFWQ